MSDQDDHSNDTESKASDAIKLLKQEHQSVVALLDSINTGDDKAVLSSAEQLRSSWCRHLLIEQELFTPAARESGVEGDQFDDAEIERDLANILLMDIMRCGPRAELYRARLRIFSKLAREIMEGEERPRSGLFAKAKAAGVDMKELGAKIETRQQQLKENDRTLGPSIRHIRPPTGHSGQYHQENEEMRQSNMRERDDQGRFVGDDDNRGYRGWRRGPDRDDQGRFMSDDDRGGYRSRGRDDYDDRQSGGRSHGGWFGDPGGHSEASRRGWDEREDYSSRSRDSARYGDDRRYSGSRYDDDRGRGRGWYGDPEGHSEASRHGWDDRNGSPSRGRDYDDDRRYSRSRDDDGRGRGRGGWFGDPDGHSEAARRGWDEPNHGPSGWYGDSEGHSRASRRGWEGRR